MSLGTDYVCRHFAVRFYQLEGLRVHFQLEEAYIVIQSPSPAIQSTRTLQFSVIAI